MKNLLLFAMLVLPLCSFTQETFKVQLTFQDSLTGEAAIIHHGFYIEREKPGIVKVKTNATGIYEFDLSAGSCAFDLYSTKGVRRIYRLEVDGDVNQTVLFSSPGQ